MNGLLYKIIGRSFQHYLALYASRPYLSLPDQELGGDPLEIGLVVSLYSVIQVAAALPAGRWIAHSGPGCASVWGSVTFVRTGWRRQGTTTPTQQKEMHRQ